MAEDLEADLCQIIYKKTKRSNSPCCGQDPQLDNPSIKTVDSHLRNTSGLISPDISGLFERQNYCFEANNLSNIIPPCTTSGSVQGHNNYIFRDTEVLTSAVPSMEVLKVAPPTQDQDILEASTSKHNIHGVMEDKLHVSSCTFQAPGRSTLTDPPCDAISKGANPKANLLRTSTSVATEGTKKRKKRTRISRKPPTTVLEANTTNFRSMVQRLTGIRSSPLLSDFLPRKVSSKLSLDVRGRQRSQLNWPLCFSGPSVSKIQTETPQLEQSLESRTMNGFTYEDSLHSAGTPVRNVLYELRGESIPFKLQQASAGISNRNPQAHSPLSTLPNESWKFLDRSGLFASIPCSASPYKITNNSNEFLKETRKVLEP